MALPVIDKDDETIVTVEELSARVGLGKQMLMILVNSGELPHERYGKRASTIRFRLGQAAEALRQRAAQFGQNDDETI